MSKKKSSPSLGSYVLGHCRPFWICILFALLVAVVDALVPTGISYLTKIIVDRVGITAPTDLLSAILAPILLILILKITLEVFWQMFSYFIHFYFFPLLKKSILNERFTQVLHKSYIFYQSHKAGDLAHSLIRVSKTVPLILKYIHGFLMTFFLVVMSVYALYQVHIGFGALLLGWVGIMLFLVLFFNDMLVRQTKFFSAKEMNVYGRVLDVLMNIFTVHVFSRRSFEEKKTSGVVKEVVKSEQRVALSYFWLFLFLSITYLGFQALSLFGLVWLRKMGEVTPGDFALVLGLNNTTSMMVWWRVREVAEMTILVGESKQALEVLNMSKNVEQIDGKEPLVVKEGAISFQNVTFGYEESGEATLQDFSLEVPAGQRVGFVGFSGAGKSTCIKLLLRLYEVEKGAILIDGQDIAKVKGSSLHRQVGVVPQNPMLFHMSIGDNIRYGNLEATKEEVIGAAKKAHAHEFILQMNQGYATQVGSGGDTISGGQKQRIAMARAILKNAPILILDEATSQLDAITERHIQSSLDGLMKEKTVLIIAHRLSTLEKLDRIIVLDGGKIVEDGKHDELLKRKGFYYKLWSAQHYGLIGV